MKTPVSATAVCPSPRVAAWLGGAVLVVVTACLTATFAQTIPILDLPAGWADKLTDDKPVATESENADEFRAFNQIVRHVRNMPLAALANAVAPGVTPRQLYEDERSQFRGKIVHVTGQLKRLKKIAANAELKKDGLVELYEGWVEDKFTFDKPTCVIFTDAPQGIDEAKEPAVVLDGYSFKRVKDPVQGLAPLVIGRALKRQDTGAESANRVVTDPRCDCPQEWLEHIEDDTGYGKGGVTNPDEILAYNYFVLRARQVPAELMAKHARPELTFSLLFGPDRSKYRGEIAHVEGRLKRLIWIGPTTGLEREGVKDLYEAWIFREGHYDYPPICVLVSDPPPGLTPAEDIRDVTVSFDGYFFKRFRYDAADKKARLAPLVIGHTMKLKAPVVNAGDTATFSAFSKYFVPFGIALALLMVGAIVAISRYFRRGDRAIRARLRDRTAIDFVEPTAEPPARRDPEPPPFFDINED
jgi:hypothetical protein